MKKLLKAITATNKGLKEKRGSQIVDLLEGAQIALIGKLKFQVMNLEVAIEKHMDFAPSHTTQLKFDEIKDAEEWTEKLQKMRVDLFMIKRELKVAKKTSEQLFTEDTTEKVWKAAKKQVEDSTETNQD